MKIRRLTVNRFRRVRAGTSVEFGSGLNVILGRNGTGKTSLLEIAGLIAARDFSPVAKEAFDFRFDLEHSGTAFSLSVRNVAVETPDPFAEPRFEWAYEVMPADGGWRLSAEAGKPGLYVAEDGASRGVTTLSPFESMFWVLTLAATVEEDEPTWATLLAAGGDDPMRFDEELGTYRALTSRDVSSTSWGHPARSASYRSVFRGEKFYGVVGGIGGPQTGLLKALTLKQQNYANPLAALSLDQTELPSLGRACTALGVSRGTLTLTLQAVNEHPHHGMRLAWYSGMSVLFSTDTYSISDRLLSYGQKRLLSFLFYVDGAHELVIADELANGLHYDWIEVCLDAIGSKQALLASQNPLLLDHLPITDVESVRTSLVLCTEENGEMVWRNPTDAEAHDFHRAWSVGIQHVSEILRTKGLW